MNGSGWQNLILKAKDASNFYFSTSTTDCCILLPYFSSSWRNIRCWDAHLRTTTKAINRNNCIICIKWCFFVLFWPNRNDQASYNYKLSCTDGLFTFLNCRYLYFSKLPWEAIESHSLEISKTRLDSCATHSGEPALADWPDDL